MPTVFDEDKLKKELEEKKEESLKPEIYSNPALCSSINKAIKKMTFELEKLEKSRKKISDINDFIDMCEMEGDESMLGDIDSSISSLDKEINELYLATLLSGEYDGNNAYVKIHSGAGGTEACDWAGMLQRMYQMFAEKNGFKCVMTDKIDGDGAGVKSVTLKITGDNAYGYLKSEMGVHRLVRISPFDANKRRHTSFASVEVMPELDTSVEVDIRPEDLKVDVYRSGGAGGQHVNTTDSAVRITHIPTGIVVACQDERSQLKNREKAMSILKSKLYDYFQMQVDEEYARNRRNQVGTGDRSERIRTYNYPQSRLTDHRINYTSYNLDAFLNGDLDDLISNLSIAEQKEKLERITL